MEIITTKAALQAAVNECKSSGKTIGLVPTMGALHEGHASLVKRAVKENDICVVSVFVNPTQFNNKEDLAKYPRNIERDAELLSSIGAHFVFAPTPEEMYSAEEMNTTFSFDFAGLDQVMEGQRRRTGGQPSFLPRTTGQSVLRREGFPTARYHPPHGRTQLHGRHVRRPANHRLPHRT